MSEPNDLLDKTDALLGRYRGSARTPDEADFPVLTDILIEPSVDAGMAGAGTPEVAPVRDNIEAAPPSEDRLLQEVMLALAPKIEEILGDPLRERLEEHLRGMLQTLAAQVHIDLEALVRMAVSQAVERVLSEKKNP